MWRMGGGSAKRGWTPPAAGLLLGLAAAPALAALLAEPTLSRTTVPARGRQEVILTVPAFGRYAVTVASTQGTALQLVDRIAGPGQAQGTTGKSDGRLDVFLDRGEYQVVAYAPEKGSGDAQLKVRGFTEGNAPEPPLLVELKPVETGLDDYEQRSWWVEVKERRRVILEAAGRNLADLRLWTGGSWLVDAEPVREAVAAQPGRRMLVCRLAAELNPGLYLLTAYGGASQPQAEESAEHPLHLRFGIPRRSAPTAGSCRAAPPTSGSSCPRRGPPLCGWGRIPPARSRRRAAWPASARTRSCRRPSWTWARAARSAW